MIFYQKNFFHSPDLIMWRAGKWELAICKDRETAGPTPVGIFLLGDVGVELRVSCEWKCSPGWLLQHVESQPQKTRKRRASCLGSTMSSTVRSMARTCSGEAVRNAKGPIRCSAHEWQR